MALFTVGTGIGGGIVLRRAGPGRARHRRRAGAHPGRRTASSAAAAGRGCLEQYASGNALVRCAKAGAPAEPGRADRLLDLAGGESSRSPARWSPPAARGDPVALAAFDQIGHWLGRPGRLVQVVDPQMIVVGGGVIDAGELLLRPARRGYPDALAQRGRCRWPRCGRRDGQRGRRGGGGRPGPAAERRKWTGRCACCRTTSTVVRRPGGAGRGRPRDRARHPGRPGGAPPVPLAAEVRRRWPTTFGLVVAGGGLPSLGNLILMSLRVRVRETWCLCSTR